MERTKAYSGWQDQRRSARRDARGKSLNMETPLQERRAHVRQKSFLQGRIYYNNRRATSPSMARG
jgi:hypothetical protein